MNRKTRWTPLLLLAVTASAQATIFDNYPLIDLAFVGDHVVDGPAGSMVTRPFGLRITNASGHPIPGLTVNFETDQFVEIPGGEPVPPLDAYGSFSAGQRELSVVTDANGVALSPDYRIGQIPHGMLAYLPDTPQNHAAIQGGTGLVIFHVNQAHVGPPDPQAPLGSAASAPLPVDSVTALMVLIGGLLVSALASMRKAIRIRSPR